MNFGRFKSYFVYHRAERYGSYAVLLLCFTAMLLVIFIPRFIDPEIPGEVFMAQGQYQQIVSEGSMSGGVGEAPPDQGGHSLFAFDPNTLSDSGYLSLGFTPKEVGTLRKYLAAGASFRQKDDFSRLYFMDDLRFDSIRPYILLPEKTENKKTKYNKPQRDTTKWSDTARYTSYRYNAILADLNTSDTTELKKVPGIGSYYARKIVEYREQLGGYHNLGQLLELWKMTPEAIDRFADRVSIDESEIEKIPINKATAQRLSRHPYIQFSLANKIVTQREARGRFNDIHELEDLGLLNAELRLKLAPYLQFE